jgi:amidophosphoribosyltransferase
MKLRRELIEQGSLFQATSDTEVIIHLMAKSRAASVEDRLIEALKQVEGAYSLVCLTNDAVIGIRDPLGVRPLVLGNLGGAHILASESCALDIIGATLVRDIEPGEIIVITAEGLRSYKPFAPQKKRFCVFEHIYFARPDSTFEGQNVYEARKRIGAELAKESPVKADLVVPASGIPFELGIIRNHYVGRTFIEPTDHVRHLGVKLKHNANQAILKGKRVILVDDSIVRGTTSKKIVSMVREAGAKEVHMRIASPPTTHSCFYGVDTPERSQLLAALHDVKAMAKLIGVDSLAFISIDGLYRAMGEKGRNNASPQYCDACFTGDYPIALTDKEGGFGKGSTKDLFAGLAEV